MACAHDRCANVNEVIVRLIPKNQRRNCFFYAKIFTAKFCDYYDFKCTKVVKHLTNRYVFRTCFQPDEITLLQFGLGAPQNSQINDGSQQQNANGQNTPVYRESRGMSIVYTQTRTFLQTGLSIRKIVISFQFAGRSVGVGPMRRPGDRKIDTSPYSSGNVAYLSPPNEWRRTSSDSAIHQSLSQNQVSPFQPSAPIHWR